MDNSEPLDIFDQEDDDEDFLFGGDSTADFSDVPPPEIDAEPPEPKIEVTVSDDKLYAYLTISQSPPVPYQVTVDDIYNALAEARVEYGVLLEKIDQIVNDHEYPNRELIAVGKQMVPGIDGELEYLFSLADGGRPKDMGHYVDHYNLNLVENVKKGQVLVRKIPPQPGEPGMSVFGQPLRAPRAKDVRLPVGKGTMISEENPLELVAKTDGFVRLDTHSFNRVVVEDVFKVTGDVDLSTGNLDVEGSVNILGSVRDGFTVKSTGSIKISGVMEGGVLQAGGSIEVVGGVVGGKRGAELTAEDDIIVKFADNARMTAGNNISVADEALNCELHADKTIVVGGRGKASVGAIIGGFVSAGQEIRAVSIGTDAGILTRLRVGEQPGLIERRRKMQADIKQHKDKIAELSNVIKSLTQRQSEREAARQERAARRPALEKQQSDLAQQMHAILADAERGGAVTSARQIEALENEIEETRGTLRRVESSIETLKERIEAKKSIGDVLKNKKTLEQFQAARQNMINKLSDLEGQLAHRRANPWGNLPWATRRELEQLQGNIKMIQAQLSNFDAEDATDQKIADALNQLTQERATLAYELDMLQQELEMVKNEIEKVAQQVPRVVVSDKLWAGSEVIIRHRRRRFTRDRTGVRIQLSENDAIIALNIS
ncbi:MAG: DUF342 domain-containing protein [Chloroflexi bacterium]|nr:MAG: DUF342 domain-containing protein [Chloroflexota bacterium]